LARSLSLGEQQAQSGGVHEGHAGQVDDQLAHVDRAEQRGLELGRGGQVELADGRQMQAIRLAGRVKTEIRRSWRCFLGHPCFRWTGSPSGGFYAVSGAAQPR
jgi:hypothetical protein